MKKIFKIILILIIIGVVSYIIWCPRPSRIIHLESTSTTTTAMFANGCFWCVEADLEKVRGVIKVTSGYAGGTKENPTYENYSTYSHREVVEVEYDPTKVTYQNLVEYILKHGDPTDAEGSFGDRGVEYAPAIYYDTEAEKKQAIDIISLINAKKIFMKPINISIIPRVIFWPAEEYHQNYYLKNPIRYNYYRNNSGRDVFIEKYWKNNTTMFSSSTSAKYPWESYVKPEEGQLQKSLTPIQYDVTQEEGTEKPFANEYDSNKQAGIYVDVLSGEPLYSSKDKYDSGTGWPSFVKPITPDAVVLREDKKLFATRIEVRSAIADSHLGHVFDDGPKERGGKRYCMNSSAMRFIPLENMVAEGYGDFVKFVE